MFEKLFTYAAVLKRHREGPLARERATYLERLASQGMARETLLWRARYSLCVARGLEGWPIEHRFVESDIDKLATAWATTHVAQGMARGPKWPHHLFHFAATDFLRTIGRLDAPPPVASGPYEHQIADFVVCQHEGQWLSEATCQAGRWQVGRFLKHLEQQGLALCDVESADVDRFFQHMAQQWSRASLRTSAKMLRSWFAYCEGRGWVRRGLAAAVLLPRIYREEGLPLGPTWDEIACMLAMTAGDAPVQIRDHAILRLLSVYGLRSGEVRRLKLDDVDWRRERIQIVRSKTSRVQTLPLEPGVGNAIAHYLRHARPKSASRIVFLTVRAPHRPLSAGGLYDVVHRHLPESASPRKGRGPHGLRHACARHLVESGRSFKEVGDHLGHRSPDATRIYAKVDLTSLRRVALDDLGGLQ
jgi:site-specific recombinase XerD